MTVYLLHGQHPDGRVIHYTGFTLKPAATRFKEHLKGTSKFTNSMQRRGFVWQLVREWGGETKIFERELKNINLAKCLCPCCGEPVLNIKGKSRKEIAEMWEIKNGGGADATRVAEGADHAGEEFVH